MSWSELTSRRGRGSLQFADGAGTIRFESVLGLDLHYESVLGSGAWDTRVDFTPSRINDATLDGWRVTAANWHMDVGRPGNRSDDAWLGFGGRQGAHTLYYRLKRWGYLHWPTRAWQDVGGAPDFNRTRLTRTVNTTTLGPAGATVNVSSSVDVAWADIWTRGGGGVALSWHIAGRGVKETITVAQAARDDVAANDAATTVAGETWHGFLFELDVGDVPRWRTGGVYRSPDEGFSDDAGAIELLDDDDRLLARIPLDFVHSSGDTTARVALRKRIYRDPDDGRIYLFVGARVDELAGLAAGDLVFDPTFESQPDDANEEDTYIDRNNPTSTFGWVTELRCTSDQSILMRFDCSDIPAFATCLTASLTLTASNVRAPATVRAYSWHQNVATWNHNEAKWNIYKAGTNWPGSSGGNTPNIDYEPSELGNGIRASSSKDEAISVDLNTGRIADWFGATNSNYGLKILADSEQWVYAGDYTGDASKRPTLTITYSDEPPEPATAVAASEGPAAVVYGSTSTTPDRAAAAATTRVAAVIQGSVPPTLVAYMGNIFLTSKGARVSVLLLATAGDDWRLLTSGGSAEQIGATFTRHTAHIVPE